MEIIVNIHTHRMSAGIPVWHRSTSRGWVQTRPLEGENPGTGWFAGYLMDPAYEPGDEVPCREVGIFGTWREATPDEIAELIGPTRAVQVFRASKKAR